MDSEGTLNVQKQNTLSSRYTTTQPIKAHNTFSTRSTHRNHGIFSSVAIDYFFLNSNL